MVAVTVDKIRKMLSGLLGADQEMPVLTQADKDRIFRKIDENVNQDPIMIDECIRRMYRSSGSNNPSSGGST